MKVTNAVLLQELLEILEGMDYFALYPSRESLRIYIRDAVSDSDKIRVILQDEYVQRELFPEYKGGETIADPLSRYLILRNEKRLT